MVVYDMGFSKAYIHGAYRRTGRQTLTTPVTAKQILFVDEAGDH